MKAIHAVLTVLAALLFTSTFAFAAAEPGAKRMEIKIAADDEPITIEASDMEVGETRQSFTESGKEVLVTRTEEGFQLEVDGKEIDVDLPHAGDHGHGHHATFNMSGDEEGKVIIRKFVDGDEHGYHFVHAAAGEDVDLVIERFSAADRLVESGVLDDLDEAKRQEILDALREMEPHRILKQMRVKVDTKIHEEHDGDQ